MALASQTVRHDYMNKIGEEEEATEKRSVEEQERQGEETETGGTPKRYVPLCDLYSATSPCVNGGIMSKKVKARKMSTAFKTNATSLLDQSLIQPHRHLEEEEEEEEEDHRHTSSDIKSPPRPPLIKFYTRRRRPKRPRVSPDSLVGVKEEQQEEEVDTSAQLQKKKRKKNSDKKNKGKALVSTLGLGVDSSTQLQASRLRNNGEKLKNYCANSSRRRKSGGLSGSLQNPDHSQMVNSAAKRWVRYVPSQSISSPYSCFY